MFSDVGRKTRHWYFTSQVTKVTKNIKEKRVFNCVLYLNISSKITSKWRFKDRLQREEMEIGHINRHAKDSFCTEGKDQVSIWEEKCGQYKCHFYGWWLMFFIFKMEEITAYLDSYRNNSIEKNYRCRTEREEFLEKSLWTSKKW